MAMKFIGNEFLTWLWFIIDANQDYLKTVDQTIVALNIGNRIVLENNSNDSSEIITIKGNNGLIDGF